MGIDATFERITNAALTLLLQRGVRRTTLADVAYEAGVTRVTIYRYCKDKRGMVRAACMRIAAIFQKAATGGVIDIDLRLSQLGKDLSELPKGNLLARFEEIGQLYPEVYEEFRAARHGAIDQLFRQTLSAATQERTLREEINLDVLKVLFWAAVMGLVENSALISSNISLAEIFATVTEVFQHGVLKAGTAGEGYVP